jgi:hypothetical protein
LKGRAKLVPWFYELVAADPELVEASINAGGRAAPRVIDGKRGRFVESIDKGHSVDWVVVGGAGGKIDALLEAHVEEQRQMYEDLTVEQLVEARPDLIRDVLEGPLNEDRTKLQELLESKSESQQGEEMVEATAEPTGEEESTTVALTEAEIVERAEQIAQAKIDAYIFKTNCDKQIETLVEAADGLPRKAKDALISTYKAQKFEDMDSLIEAVSTGVKERQDEILEALAADHKVEGLGPSIAADLREARSTRTRGRINSVIDRRLDISVQPADGEDS